eukprot:5193266-Pleurochrysis_carterae.AAC.1
MGTLKGCAARALVEGWMRGQFGTLERKTSWEGPAALISLPALASLDRAYLRNASVLRSSFVHQSNETASAVRPGPSLRVAFAIQDLQRQKHLMKQLHSNFIAAVKDGRGDRLQPEARPHASLFSAPSKRANIHYCTRLRPMRLLMKVQVRVPLSRAAFAKT